MSSVFQRILSAYLRYIRSRSLPNSAASSPPVPALTSRITFLSSLGSFGRSRILRFSVYSSIAASLALSSSRAISRSSSSSSISRISLASSSSSFAFLYAVYSLTIGSRSLISFISFCHSFCLAITSGSETFFDSSSYFSSIKSSLSNIITSFTYKL